MPSPIPVTATSTLSSFDIREPSQLADRLTQTRNKLIGSGYYLGDPSNRVHQNVVWKRIGRCYQLYTRHHEATTATGTQHDETSRTSSQTLSQRQASVPRPIPEQAILYAVVKVGDSSFITPCGNWKGPTEFTKSFGDVKLSFSGVCPPAESIFRNDFWNSLDNALRLMGQVAVPDVMDKGFLTVPQGSIAEEFKFRHALFDEPDYLESELDERFSLSNWPIIHPAAQNARDLMLRTNSHQLMPVPAYDLSGRLIPPQDYRTVLPGSIARIAFTLTHWFIDERHKGKSASNTFTADLVSLRVLVKPPPVTPRRRTRERDPEPELLASPTTRRI